MCVDQLLGMFQQSKKRVGLLVTLVAIVLSDLRTWAYNNRQFLKGLN